MRITVSIVVFLVIFTLFFRYAVYRKSLNLYGAMRNLINSVNFQRIEKNVLNLYAAALLKRGIDSEHPTFRSKSDFEKTSFIRDWVGLRTTWTSTPSADINTVKDYQRVFSFVRQDRSQPPLLCNTISEVLSVVYSLYSLESYRYHFGRLDGWNHVSNLVRIKQNNKTRLILQDASMNITFTDRFGNPYDFFVLLKNLIGGSDDTVLAGQANDYPQFVCSTKTKKCRRTGPFSETNNHEEKVRAEVIEKLLDALTIPRQIDGASTDPKAKQITETIKKIVGQLDFNDKKIPDDQIIDFGA